jgi:hypothetical protein
MEIRFFFFLGFSQKIKRLFSERKFMKKILFNFGLVSLAACQSACTFSDYAAEQDGKCVAAPSSGTCPSLTAGTPTLYGSVMNADNKIATVFADY